MRGDWKPGDIVCGLLEGCEIVGVVHHLSGPPLVYYGDSVGSGSAPLDRLINVRRMAVVDPEDDGNLNALRRALYKEGIAQFPLTSLKAAIREFTAPTPSEPTDPRARVSDRRDNIWRLLADGDWVCTSGPDCGEYLIWSRLAADRGPLAVTLP